MQDLFPLLDPSRVVFGIHAGALDLLITTESIINSYKKPFFADKVSSEMQHRKNFGQSERYFFKCETIPGAMLHCRYP